MGLARPEQGSSHLASSLILWASDGPIFSTRASLSPGASLIDFIVLEPGVVERPGPRPPDAPQLGQLDELSLDAHLDPLPEKARLLDHLVLAEEPRQLAEAVEEPVRAIYRPVQVAGLGPEPLE